MNEVETGTKQPSSVRNQENPGIGTISVKAREALSYHYISKKDFIMKRSFFDTAPGSSSLSTEVEEKSMDAICIPSQDWMGTKISHQTLACDTQNRLHWIEANPLPEANELARVLRQMIWKYGFGDIQQEEADNLWRSRYSAVSHGNIYLGNSGQFEASTKNLREIVSFLPRESFIDNCEWPSHHEIEPSRIIPTPADKSLNINLRLRDHDFPPKPLSKRQSCGITRKVWSAKVVAHPKASNHWKRGSHFCIIPAQESLCYRFLPVLPLVFSIPPFVFVFL